ncbi:unnamed protein product [Calicophoron daubneyi]|uniref:Non-specific serine/threonine protein kinase n=1 Tax=Calicophoron daubneyi TaxID=300641 RepID=A0AAV2THD6_CALDB
MLTYDPISRITLREICRHPFIRDGTAVSTPDLFAACTNKGKLADENPYLPIYPIPRLADRHRGLKLENSPIHRKRDEPPRRIDYNEKLLHMDLGFTPEFKGNKKWEKFNEDRPDRFRKRGYAGQLNEGLFVKRTNEENGNLEDNQRRKPGGRVLGGNFYSPQLGHRNPAEFRKLVLEHKPRFPLAKDVGGYVPRYQRFLPDKRPEVPYLRRKFSEPNLYFPSDSPTPPLDLDRISPASPGKYNNVDGPRAGSPETDQNKSPVQSKLPGAQMLRRKPSLGPEGLLCKPITSGKDDALKVEDQLQMPTLFLHFAVAQTAEHEPVGELEGIETLAASKSKRLHLTGLDPTLTPYIRYIVRRGDKKNISINLKRSSLLLLTSNADCADPTKEPSDFVPPVKKRVSIVCGEDAVAKKTARDWFARFRHNNFDPNDAFRSEGPAEMEEDQLGGHLRKDGLQTCRELGGILVLIVDGDRLKLEITLEWCELVQEMVDQENQTLTSSSHFTNPKNPKKLEDTGMVAQWVKKRKMICKFMATSLKQMFEERKTTSSDKSKLSSSAIIAALLKDLEKYRKRFESQAQSVIISTSPAGSEATAEVLIFERALSLHESATTAEFLGKSLEALKHLRKAIILAYGTLQYSKVLGGDNITFGTIQKWKKHFNELAYTKQMVNGVNSPKCAENGAQDCILRPIMLPIIPNNDRMKDH